MERVFFIIQMGIYIKVNGQMIRQAEWERILIVMGQNMLVSGRTINKMAREDKYGQMDRYMRDNMLMGQKMALEI